MAARRGDFERALGAFLALDFPEIDERAFCLADLWLRTGEHLGAAKMVGELDQRSGRDDRHLRAHPGGFGAARGRADQPFVARIGADRGRQHARDRGDRAVEPELTQNSKSGERIHRDGPDRGHQAERDRKIVVAAFLWQVGGRQVDGDAAGRQREAGRHQRRSHAFLGLGDGLVGQADNVEGRQPGRDLHLHVDGARLDAFERHCGDTLDHRCPCPAGRLAQPAV